MRRLFISDCHLSNDRPHIVQYFVDYLAGLEQDADELFILGDLFDVWTASEAQDPGYREVIASIRRLSGHIPVFFMRGNRDFLVDAHLMQQMGCTLLPDLSVHRFDGQNVLLMHGDLLCTDDVNYQRYRQVIRHPLCERFLMLLPDIARRQIGKVLRKQSREAMQHKGDEIMDVTQESVEETMRDQGVRWLIHGHTHRPDIHRFELGGQSLTRAVLGDWYDDGSVLIFENGDVRLETLNIK